MVLFEAAEMDFEKDLLYSITYENASVRIRKIRIPVFSIGLNEKLDDSTFTVLDDQALNTATFEFLGDYYEVWGVHGREGRILVRLFQ